MPLHVAVKLGEEDVQKVVKQAGKVSQKAIVSMAAALDSVPFWKERKDEYMRAAPAMLAHGHKVETYANEVVSLPDELRSLSLFKPILAALPELNSKLRTGCTASLMEKCNKKLMDLWPIFTRAAAEDVATCHLHEMVEVLAVAAGLFPLEGEIQQMQKCSTMQKKKGHEVLVASFRLAMHQCHEQATGDHRPIVECLSGFIDAVHHIKLPALDLDSTTALTSYAMALMKVIFQDASKKLATAPGDLACLATFVKASMLLAEKLKQDSLQKQATLLEVLQQALQSKAVLDLQNQDQWLVAATENNLVESLVALKRALQKIAIAKKEVGQIEQCFLDQVDISVESMDMKYKAIKEHLLSESLSTVQTCCAQLAPHAQGGAEGKSWLEGFDGKTFASIEAHAHGSLLKLDPVEYIAWQAQLDQA
eukprot:4787429-Amphidinium_carterae.4